MENTVTISMEEYNGLKKDVDLLMAKLKETKGAFSLESVSGGEGIEGHVLVVGSGGYHSYGCDPYQSVTKEILNYKPLDKNDSIIYLVGSVERLLKELTKSRGQHKESIERNKSLTGDINKVEQELEKEKGWRTTDLRSIKDLKGKLADLDSRYGSVMNSACDWQERCLDIYDLPFFKPFPKRPDREFHNSTKRRIPKYPR